MLARIVGLIQAWDDAEKDKDIFAPDQRLFEVEAQGYQECVAGRFRLAPGDPAFNVSAQSLAVIRAMLLVVEGVPGADVSINGAPARQIRPASDADNAQEEMPRAFYLETTDDLDPSANPPMSIVHGDNGTSTADPIAGFYVLIGDPSS